MKRSKISGNIARIEATGMTYNNIMATTRKQIHKFPLCFYQELYHQTTKGINLEVAHYIERIWVSLFLTKNLN